MNFKPKPFPTRAMAATVTCREQWELEQPMTQGKQWGPFFWGRGEFGSFFSFRVPGSNIGRAVSIKFNHS